MAGPNHLPFPPAAMVSFLKGPWAIPEAPCSDHSHHQQHRLSPRHRAPQSCPHKPGSGPGPGPGCSHPSPQSRRLAQQRGRGETEPSPSV